jgi:hypothetical protein
MATKNNNDLIYRAIKIVEAFVIIGLGVIICIFNSEDNLKNAIGYCVATALLIFGLLNIAFAYIFDKGLLSYDTFSGVFITTLSILVFSSPTSIMEFLPIFIGVLLIVYSVAFIFETVTLYIQKTYFRAIFYTVATSIILVGGILILIYKSAAEIQSAITIIIGAAFILVGLIMIATTVAKMLQDNKKLKAEKTEEKKKSEAVVIDATETAKPTSEDSNGLIDDKTPAIEHKEDEKKDKGKDKKKK